MDPLPWISRVFTKFAKGILVFIFCLLQAYGSQNMAPEPIAWVASGILLEMYIIIPNLCLPDKDL